MDRLFVTGAALAAIGVGIAAGLPAQAQENFPVTFTHAFGETTLEAAPERIVTVGWMSQDAVLALGAVPVGIPLQSWGGDENGMLPWVTEALDAMGADYPERLDFGGNGNEIPFEQILALDPDLILAPYSGFDETGYRRLADIAPTIAYADGVWSGTWQEIVSVTGRALGKSDEAETVIAETEAIFSEVAAEHPEFEGKTFTFGYAYPADAGMGVYVSTDPRVQMIEDMGLMLSPGAAALPTDNFYVDVSLEELDTVTADVLITWHDSEADLEAIRANPVFARFAPVANDAHVALTDQSFSMALSAPSPLSIPWAMERFAPQLADALD